MNQMFEEYMEKYDDSKYCFWVDRDIKLIIVIELFEKSICREYNPKYRYKMYKDDSLYECENYQIVDIVNKDNVMDKINDTYIGLHYDEERKQPGSHVWLYEKVKIGDYPIGRFYGVGNYRSAIGDMK